MTAQIHPLSAPHRVERPVMLQGWKQIAYAHWRVPAAELQQRLPQGLLVDTFDGSAWVGLVAFYMERIRLPGTPAIPYLGSFPETNVRTYVTDQDGRPGVWFDSLDVTRLLPVVVARASYQLPYMWAAMSIDTDAETLTYRTRRRWPAPRGASSEMTIRRGHPISAPSPLDAFLTARWGLYTRLGSRLAFAPVEHEPWPLESATIDYLEDDLVAAAGYRISGPPVVVHYSRGVDVRIGLPRRLDV